MKDTYANKAFMNDIYLELYMLSMKEFHGASYNIYTLDSIKQILDSGFLPFREIGNPIDCDISCDEKSFNASFLEEYPLEGIDLVEFEKLVQNAYMSCSLFSLPENFISPTIRYLWRKKGRKYAKDLVIWSQKGETINSSWVFEGVKDEFIRKIEIPSAYTQHKFPRHVYKDGLSFLSNKVLDKMEESGDLYWYFFAG